MIQERFAPTMKPRPFLFDISLPHRFSLTPGAPCNASDPTQEDEEKLPEDRPRRALVVDDAPDVTEMLAMVLRHAGYEVTMAFSGSGALDAAHREHFDVVVSDIGMPGMNGYELAEGLRGLSRYKDVPLIAVTGFAMYADRDRALQSGFNAYLSKPINPLDLIEVIKRLRG